MTNALTGQVALVTGASRGIGRAVACHLARAGAHVLVNFLRNTTAADETLAEIAAAGGRAPPSTHATSRSTCPCASGRE